MATMRPTQRRRAKPKVVEPTPTITVADYFRQKLTQVPPDPTPASHAEYLHQARWASPPRELE